MLLLCPPHVRLISALTRRARDPPATSTPMGTQEKCVCGRPRPQTQPACLPTRKPQPACPSSQEP
ncbi:hypothetical protein T484DRAFT_1933557 [Baffinella frigidus]|nr:hypothetical protein T484DRAFT_1933557 [Cryptophyta sp. CCMP2293]